MGLEVTAWSNQSDVAQICKSSGFRVPDSVRSSVSFTVKSSSARLDVEALLEQLNNLSVEVPSLWVDVNFSKDFSARVVPSRITDLVPSSDFSGSLSKHSTGMFRFFGSCPVLSLTDRIAVRNWETKRIKTDKLMQFAAGLVPSDLLESLQVQAAVSITNGKAVFDTDVSREMFGLVHAAGFDLRARGQSSDGFAWYCNKELTRLIVRHDLYDLLS